jgi:xanthine dehydrogenase YagS FAD-binding subunit
MRETVERPGALVDISALPLRDVTTAPRGGLRIGALVRMAEAAAHPRVRTAYIRTMNPLSMQVTQSCSDTSKIGTGQARVA